MAVTPQGLQTALQTFESNLLTKWQTIFAEQQEKQDKKQTAERQEVAELLGAVSGQVTELRTLVVVASKATSKGAGSSEDVVDESACMRGAICDGTFRLQVDQLHPLLAELKKAWTLNGVSKVLGEFLAKRRGDAMIRYDMDPASAYNMILHMIEWFVGMKLGPPRPPRTAHPMIWPRAVSDLTPPMRGLASPALHARGSR